MSEKKLHTLTIDPEFRDLIPPLNDDELAMLEESIIANGCESPLIVWNGVIVDGHNRHAICQKHGIPFTVTEKEFSSREDAMLWMLRNQLGRRNLNDYQRGEMVLTLKERMATEAEKRKLAGVSDDNLPENFREGSVGGNCKFDRKERETYTRLGKLAGVSDRQLRKIEKLTKEADEGTKSKLRKGEVSVHKAYTDLMEKEHEGEVKVCDRCKQEKVITSFSIPSNRHGFSSLCKDCEKEINAAAKAAAEVTSATTAKVETHPVNGMAMLNGAPIHVVTPLPDEPEMMPHVMSTLEVAVHAFHATVRTSLRLMTKGIATKENLRVFRDALFDATEYVHEMFNDYVKELEEQ